MHRFQKSQRLMVLGLMLGLAGAVTGAGPALADDPGGLSDAEIQQILAIHNRERAEVGTPPLTWSTEVSAHAGEWARTLQGEGCALRHRDQGRIYGESIADLIKPSYPAATAPQRWTEGRRYTASFRCFSPTFTVLCGMRPCDIRSTLTSLRY